MKRVALIFFPGSNCERETALAIKRAGMVPVECLWNDDLIRLATFDAYVLMGGFSYEDRSRAGIIAALDPVMTIIKEQNALGKPVLGICNGAQILVQSGLVPGLDCAELALTENKRMSDGKLLGLGFYNAWHHIRLSEEARPTAFTLNFSSKNVIRLPVAHGEGRFVVSENCLQQLKDRGLIVFQYCDQGGEVSPDFPVNPNGSMANIAALANEAGTAMAIMPHPERSVDGDVIFASLREYLEGEGISHRIPAAGTRIPATCSRDPVDQLNSTGSREQVAGIRHIAREQFAGIRLPAAGIRWTVALNITDNHALTVQNTLRSLGFPVQVKRFIHWELVCEPRELEAIKKSGLLFSPRKEYLTEVSPLHVAYLVRSKDDVLGQRTKQLLENNFAITTLQVLKSGVLWQFISEGMPLSDYIQDILSTNIIKDPYAHDCFEY